MYCRVSSWKTGQHNSDLWKVRSPKERSFCVIFSQAALGTLKLQLFQKLFPELAELLTKVYLLTSNKESRRVQVESRKRPISI